MSEEQSVCRMSRKAGHSGLFSKEKAVTVFLLYAVSPLILLSPTFPHCLEASISVLHCRCECSTVIRGTDIDGD